MLDQKMKQRDRNNEKEEKNGAAIQTLNLRQHLNIRPGFFTVFEVRTATSCGGSQLHTHRPIFLSLQSRSLAVVGEDEPRTYHSCWRVVVVVSPNAFSLPDANGSSRGRRRRSGRVVVGEGQEK